MVTGDARVAPRSSLVMVERFTPLILASSIWVSCFRWRSFFSLLSLRTLQILTKLVHAAQAAPLPLFTELPTENVWKIVRVASWPYFSPPRGSKTGLFALLVDS